MQSRTSKIILAVVITALVVGGGVYAWQKQTNTPTSNPAPIVTETSKPVAGETAQPTTTTPKIVTDPSVQPVIASPKAGSTVAGPTVTIEGTAMPNASLWAYVNYPASERLGVDSYANGGAGIVGADGTFALDLAEPCSHSLTVVVVAVPPSDDYADFWDKYTDDVISEPVSFTTTGALSGVCTQ
jgi:hypothetical protein